MPHSKPEQVVTRLEALRLHPYDAPLDRPLKTAWGTWTTRRGWWIEATDSAGRTGWGEAAPWPGFGGGWQATALALEAARANLPGADLQTLSGIASLARASPPRSPEAIHAIELALADLLAQAAGQPLAHLMHPRPATRVRLHALVSDVREAQSAIEGGHTRLKLKIGAASVTEDLERVAAVRQAVGPNVELVLDANGAFGPAGALELARRLRPYRIALLEQPTLALEGMARVRSEGIPVAADEVVKGAGALAAVLEAGAADAVVLKPMYAGGLTGALRLARLAQGAGLKVIVTGALESRVGRAGALHLAAAVRADSAGLEGRMASELPWLPKRSQGTTALPHGPGLGVRP